MHRIPRSSFSFAVLLALASLLPAQSPRPLTHDDYDGWKSLRGTSYAADGSWVAYAIEPQWGDCVLEVREVAGPGLHRLERGSNPRFTADGRFVVFTRLPSKVAERDKKIAELRKKAKEANMSAAEKAAEKEAEAKSGEASAPAAAVGEGPRRGGGRRPGGGGPGGSGTGAGGPGAAPGGDEAAARERGELCVLELATGTLEVVGKVKGSTVSDDAPFLLIHKEKAEAKPAKQDEAKGTGPSEGEAQGGGAKGEAPKSEVAKGEGGGAKGEAAASEGEAKPAARAEKPKDPLEGKRPEGTELVIRDLRTGEERVLADVVAYGLSGKGRWLWYHTSHKQPKEGASYGLFVEPLAGGEPLQLLDGIAHVGNVTFARDEQVLAFTSDKEEFAADQPANDLYLWEGGDGPARRIAHAGAPGMPAGKRVAGSLSFSRDGSTLSFDVHDAPAKEPLPILPEDKVALDLWNWRDGQLQTQQQKQGAGERNPSWTATWRRAERKLAVLGDDGLRSLRFLGASGERLLGSEGRAYEKETTWDGRYVDVWVVDGRTGARTRVLEKLRGSVSASPGGRYLLWFSPDYHWWSLDVTTGARRDLTGALPVPFHRHDDDHPEPDSAYGLAGWTEDDGAVLVHDEFDVWKITPASGDAVCVTDGHGRANRLRLRVQTLPRADDRPWVDDELLLAAVHVDSMAEGFFADSLVRNQLPQRLLFDDCSFDGLTRPKHATRLFFTRSTFATFPDLWTANADFRGMQRLSDANPQQREFRWGDAELVHWVDGDGKPRQGVLVKPDGFDPKKRYPMMVYFYERMTQGLHNYVAPAPGTSPNASYYVSNGYLWFMPDVVYEVGYPGNSCVKCVTSGVQHLVAQGFVDPNGIAAAGHSWGGYQTAFLVTRTNLFACVESGAPVSNMLSAYGGIRYESGVSRQFQYERTQSRIGGTPWEYPLRYQENSPIWFADKVQTPVLILHNDQDGAVPWTQGIEYFTALRRLGKECYLFNYNGEGHGLRNRANMKDWTRRMAEYFDHHCKGAPAPKWMTDGVPFHERDDEKLPFAQSYVDAHVKPAPSPAAPAAVATAEAVAAKAQGAASEAGSDGAKGRDDGERPAGARQGRSRRGGSAEAPAKFARGAVAPEFVATDETGTTHRLADYRGRHVLLWFYPKADTPGCTTQGCGLRDAFARFEERGVAVLGVSVDDATANGAFREKHGLPFPLLCDTERTLGLAYGACEAADARAHRRIAVLIDGDGKVVQLWSKVDPKTFAATALAALPL